MHATWISRISMSDKAANFIFMGSVIRNVSYGAIDAVSSVKKKIIIIEGNCCIAQWSRSLVSKLSGTSAIDETRMHALGKSRLLYHAVEERCECNCNCIVTYNLNMKNIRITIRLWNNSQINKKILLYLHNVPLPLIQCIFSFKWI